jgi:hypothetical protein
MVVGVNGYTAFGLFGVLVIMLLGLFSTYPAIRASEKGRNFTKWYFFSLLLFPVALILSFAVRGKKNAE